MGDPLGTTTRPIAEALSPCTMSGYSWGTYNYLDQLGKNGYLETYLVGKIQQCIGFQAIVNYDSL